MMAKNQRVRVQGNEVVLLGENEIEKLVSFPYPVAQVLEFSSAAIVRLEPPTKSCFNENVYGVSYGGEILWRIEPREHVHEDSPYTGMIQAGENAKLFNWDGAELLVDPISGHVLKEEYGK